MKLGKVEKKSFWYNVVYSYIAPALLKIFFKKTIFIGTKNIPKDKPVMIAPNHQNAVIDAFAVIMSQNHQVVFLARSDIFSSPLVSKILFFMKILPVYRIRDGKEKLALNEEIFKKTVEVLESGRRVTIFPEAQHIDKRHLRILKKGVQRVAFAAEEKNDYKLDVHIVPTGIYYSNYWNFRTTLQVRYGKPIRVADFIDIYKENAQKGMLALRDEMSKRIKELIIHISDLKHYDTYELIRDVCDKPMVEKQKLGKFTDETKFKADKITIAKTEKIAEEQSNVFEQLVEKSTKYSDFLKKNKLKDWVIEKDEKIGNLILKSLVLLIGFPVFLYGAVNNIIPFLLPNLITKNIKDRQFESSITFAMGLFTFPIFYTVQSIILYILCDNWIYSLAYFISLPIFGLLAFSYHRLFVKTKSQLKFKFNKTKPEYLEALRIREFIIKTVVN